MLGDPRLLDKYVRDLEHEVELKQVRERERLLKAQKAAQITPRTFRRRSEELERWAEAEKRELRQARKQHDFSLADLGMAK